MTSTLMLPALGDGDTEGTVISIAVQAGTVVAAGDILLEVETDKVTMEVPVECDGTVEELLVKEGDTVRAGMPYLTINAAESPIVSTVNAGDSSEQLKDREAASARLEAQSQVAGQFRRRQRDRATTW